MYSLGGCGEYLCVVPKLYFKLFLIHKLLSNDRELSSYIILKLFTNLYTHNSNKLLLNKYAVDELHQHFHYAFILAILVN